VLNDFSHFSSDMTGYNEKVEELRKGKIKVDLPTRYTMLTSDPPLHDELRSMASDVFSSAKLQSLEGFIRETAKSLLDTFQEEEDVVRKLVVPLPLIVISKLLDLSAEDWERFKDWSDLIALRLGKPEEIFAVGKKYIEMVTYVRKHLNPESELVSRVLNSNLTNLEKLDYVILLLIAGNETTTNLINKKTNLA
jgi:cytochrome P450